MEMNSASVTPEVTEVSPAGGATVFGFAPTEVVSAPSLDNSTEAAEETPQQTEQTGDEAGASEGVTDQPRLGRQKDVGKAFAAERRRRDEEIAKAKAEYESSPQYRFGQRLIRDVMDADGIDEAAAIEEVDKRLVEAFAKRENVSPGVARMLLGQQAQSAAAKPAKESAEDRAQRIVDELMSTQTPDGFDLDAAMGDEVFHTLLLEFSPAAAVRIYQAEQKVQQAEQRAANAPAMLADQLRARQAVPQSTKPTQMVNAAPDYRNMSTEEFFKLKERVQRNL